MLLLFNFCVCVSGRFALSACIYSYWFSETSSTWKSFFFRISSTQPEPESPPWADESFFAPHFFHGVTALFPLRLHRTIRSKIVILRITFGIFRNARRARRLGAFRRRFGRRRWSRRRKCRRPPELGEHALAAEPAANQELRSFVSRANAGLRSRRRPPRLAFHAGH